MSGGRNADSQTGRGGGATGVEGETSSGCAGARGVPGEGTPAGGLGRTLVWGFSSSSGTGRDPQSRRRTVGGRRPDANPPPSAALGWGPSSPHASRHSTSSS